MSWMEQEVQIDGQATRVVYNGKHSAWMPKNIDPRVWLQTVPSTRYNATNPSGQSPQHHQPHLALQAPCSPSQRCREEVRDWAGRHGLGFLPRNLGLKRLTLALSALLQCSTGPPVLVDVGAGIHGMARMTLTSDRLREDDSDSLWLLKAFRGQAQVHAFEPNAAKAAELKRTAPQSACETKQTKPQIRFIAHASIDHIITNPSVPSPQTVAATRDAGKCKRICVRLRYTSLTTSFAGLGFPKI